MITIAEDCRKALQQLGGRAHLRDIYAKVAAFRRYSHRRLTPHWQAAIRETLQRKSSDSERFDGQDDWFEMGRLHGLPVGWWSLRSTSSPRPPNQDYRRGYSAGWVAAMTQVRTLTSEPPV